MTRLWFDVPRTLQLAGLLGAGFGFALILIAGETQYLVPGLLAIAADVAAIRSGRRVGLAAAGMKLVAVFVGLSIITMGGPGLAPGPLAPGAGLVTIAISSLPSMLGALARFVR